MISEGAEEPEHGPDGAKAGRERAPAPLGSPWSGEEEEKATAAGRRFISPVHRRPGSAPEPHVRYGWAAGLVAGATVLDVGCGLGWGAALLAEHADGVVGLDVAPPLVATASQSHGSKVEFVAGDVCQMPFPAGEFDVIVCFELIERVADPEDAIDEMRRVLRPGGLLLISSANGGVYPPGNPLHMHEMTSAELERLLRRRFDNVAIHRQHTYFASFLGTASVMGSDDPRVGMQVMATKATCTSPGQELYAVAAATDGALPAAPSHISLGSDFRHDEQRRLIEAWQRRAIDVEVRAEALQTELDLARHQTAEPADGSAGPDSCVERQVIDLQCQARGYREQIEHLSSLNTELLQSASWRLTSPLRTVKRLLRRR